MLQTGDLPISCWSNGRKAIVYLLQDDYGKRIIKKIYRPGFRKPMFREFLMAAYVARRMSSVPRVLGFRPLRNELLFEYLPGDRVLEWVLLRFSREPVQESDFHSFHGIDPPHNVDPRVADAFEQFRTSSSTEASRLKQAIRDSYAALHRIGVKHGSADPRNVLYHNDRVYIIDFDNARPSLNPQASDNADLEYWYGIRSA